MPNDRSILLCRLTLLILLPLAAAGCEAAGAIASAFTGGKPVQKLHQLDNQRTLVLVDTLQSQDRVNVLATPSARNTIASDIAYFLKKEEALNAQIVPLEKLNAMAARMGEDFAALPIDTVGERLGAEQIIYVAVEQASLHVAGNLYHPTASGQVKVIDVTRGTRTFPRTTKLDAEGSGGPGHPFTTELEHVNNDSDSPAFTDQLSRQLAQQVGLDISRIFYDWHQPDMGSQIK